MFGRIVGAGAVCLALSGIAQAQVVTYYQPAPVVVQAAPRTTYYAPSISVPYSTYYAPAAVAPVTAYYAPPTTVYFAPPATTTRVNQYHSSVSSMPVGSIPSAAPAAAPVYVPAGAPPVETLAPPVITYRPVIAAPQPYVVTRGLFGRPHYYPVAPAPLVPVYVP